MRASIMFKNSIRALSRALTGRRGAVTVDFVILCAGVIMIFLVIIEPIYTGSRSMVGEINAKLIEHASDTWDFTKKFGDE